ncbi:MAG: energy-coupling factor ABC transporter permease, partial [Acidobacteriota bacterium]
MVPSPLALHIPDGFLSAGVSLGGWIVAGLVGWLALRHTSDQLGERQAPLIGVLAAFIFAAQAINFPIAGGTSGHILGAALAAVLVGPWAAILLMSAVVIVQGLLFQDGGLLVMGCNLINMGAFSVFAGYAAYTVVLRIWRRPGPAAFVGAWLSVEVGAAATAVELALSGTFPLKMALPALTGVYALVGVGEGLVTAAAITLLRSARPELLRENPALPGRTSASLLTAGMTGTLMLVLLAPLASADPDGLEAVAHNAGFSRLAQSHAFELMSGYSVSWLGTSFY